MELQEDAVVARLALAREIADQAGRLTLEYFRSPEVAVERKSDDSPVTAADREAEKLLRQRILAECEEDGIIGEEFGERAGTSGYDWVLDPIDGTKSFVCGVPLYGNLVAVVSEGRAVLGVMNFPALKESIFAAVGGGAWHVRDGIEPVRVHVSDCESLAEAVFSTSDVETFFELGRDGAYLELQAQTRLSRTWGDCYGYLLVATGRADVMVDPEMSVWDAAALQPIVEEAGGTFTDWKGEPTIHGGEGVATNGRLLEYVISITKQFT